MIKPTEDFVNLTFNTTPLIYLDLLEPPQDNNLIKEPVFWLAPFDEALKHAGEYSKYILSRLEKYIKNDKKYVVVDLKIQEFKKGNVPTELSGCFWHVDAPVMVPELYSKMLGSEKLVDIQASRIRESPRMFSFLTQKHCATQYIKEEITLNMPKCIDGFRPLSNLVNEKLVNKKITIIDQLACNWVNFHSSHLHRAVPAKEDCIRLWCRVSETDIRPVERTLPINATFELNTEMKNLL